MFRLFIPQTCIHCNVPMDSRSADDRFAKYLCADCRLSLRLLNTPTADDLYEKTHRFSQLRAGVSLDVGLPFAGADGLVQDMVHHAKYNSMMKLAVQLGEELVSRIPEPFEKCELILPVPLHRTRLAERGYNQAERIAVGISRRTKIAVAPRSILRRIKQTPTQTGLDREEREENVRGAFQLGRSANERLKNKRVMLIDDVMTTGATLASAAAEIDKAGPGQISVLAFSLAPAS